MKFKLYSIVILAIAIIAFAQTGSSVSSFFILDNVGTYTHPEPEAPSEEDLAHAEAVGSTYVAPEPASEEAQRRYEERVLANRQEKYPPIAIIDLSIPRTSAEIPTESLEDGHVLRDGRIYLKPTVEFTDITPGTAILMLAPIRSDARITESSTVQEALAAIDEEFRALSITTPGDELYIDITEIAEALRAGRIGSRFVLAPLSPRERFTIPEGRDGGLFEVVYSVE